MPREFGESLLGTAELAQGLAAPRARPRESGRLFESSIEVGKGAFIPAHLHQQLTAPSVRSPDFRMSLDETIDVGEGLRVTGALLLARPAVPRPIVDCS